ncbi:hypothetical protein H2201_003378 [Coniosporium apollinis]|uniref:ELYS-like domain-containing protein n=1 Tax=Coniosporium apollinis TaxID=61459 RepID=A0ABQ9NZG4_9PEZI|nr:hypothetical protein H2201_003378 [Coniosporium apollinis]
MLDINDFNQVFDFDPDCTYSQSTQNGIVRNRRALDNKLFFDRLLDRLNVKSSHLYPPHTNSDLRELHHQIISSQTAEHHRQSLLFYILKDCKSPEPTEPADAFAKDCHLPEKYRLAIDGLWALDRLQFRIATTLLTSPLLTPTFPSDILRTLLTHCGPSTPDADLPLAYYHTVSAPLNSDPLLRAFFDHLTHSSITDAFFFSRRHPEPTRRMLFEGLIETALAHLPSSKRADAAIELLNLPFSPEEEVWFETFLLEGKGRSLHGARDAVVARWIAVGKIAEAWEATRNMSGRRYEGVSWEGIREGLERGLGGRGEVGRVWRAEAMGGV